MLEGGFAYRRRDLDTGGHRVTLKHPRQNQLILNNPRIVELRKPISVFVEIFIRLVKQLIRQCPLVTQIHINIEIQGGNLIL